MNNLSELKSPTNEIITANYSKLSDHIRRLTPHGIQCSVFCGGSNCKYENPENWKADSLALQGIYSHWITDNILAMARPSTLIIIQKNIIQQFESLGIKSIINLQSPREHASCGQPLEESGFSYDPTIFMKHDIYYYNFAWKDYGDATLAGLLNMVKVVAFAITEGRVAIHCHAGLGRTGVLIACFLVYSLRVSANDAIRYVRLKRPGSVQTRGQILCVRHFAQFILPQSITFYIRNNANKDKYMNEFTLQRFLRRQKVVLHGYDERNFKYLPKIVHCICERILKLCGCWTEDFTKSNITFTSDFLYTRTNKNIERHESSYSIFNNSDLINFKSSFDEIPTPTSPNSSESEDPISDSFSELSTLDGDEMNEELLIENKCFQELETQKTLTNELMDETINIQNIDNLVAALLTDYSTLDDHRKIKIHNYQQEINTSQLGWTKLAMETDLTILAVLLFEWIENLKTPVLTRDNFETIVVLYKQPELCFKKITIEEACLLEYLLRFLIKIQPISKQVQTDLLKRFLAALSKQSLAINNNLIPSNKNFKRFGEGTLACAIEFLQSLTERIENFVSLNNKKLYDSYGMV